MENVKKMKRTTMKMAAVPLLVVLVTVVLQLGVLFVRRQGLLVGIFASETADFLISSFSQMAAYLFSVLFVKYVMGKDLMRIRFRPRKGVNPVPVALAAVAPLPLLRYFDESATATAMLWLSGFALVWTLLSPSVFSGERMNDARRRILRSMFSDPLVWVMLLLVLVSGVRALNGGIKMAYDAEAMIWSIAPATLKS